MKIRVVPAHHLTSAETAAWLRLQQADPALASPFFRPEFTQEVAAVRDDVRVGVLREGDEPVGFLPFHLLRGNLGLPVGAPMNDFQGVIARKDLRLSARELLLGCGLMAWRFDHVPASQMLFRPYHCARAGSPYVDLFRGYSGFCENLQARGSKIIARTLQKQRKAQREVGSVRYVPHTADRGIFQTLVDWKCRQLYRRGEPGGPGAPWRREVLDRILRCAEPGFAGVLAVLYFGQHIAAIQFGLRSHTVLQWWVIAYDARLARYSPGMILNLQTIQACESLGVRRIELGRGAEPWKSRLMTAATALAEGSIDLRFLRGPLWRTWLRARGRVRQSRWGSTMGRLHQAFGRPCARWGLDPCVARARCDRAKVNG